MNLQLLKRTLVTALIGVLWSGCAARTAQPRSGQQPGHFNSVIQKRVALDYLLFLPGGKPSPRPMIVFLHGAGERGTNVHLVATHGPPKIVQEKQDFPFVVLSPQCPPGEMWNVETLNALLDHILAAHTQSIDSKRIYLTGLSMGGFGSWAWAAANPERFAGVAPICGGGEPLAIRLASGPRRDLLSRLPIWAFHGAKDNVVPLEQSERMVRAYNTIHNIVQLTVYPDAGHDSWTETYNNPALYEWFLKHALP